MYQSALAAVAPLVVVLLAFTIGGFAARRERAQRAVHIAAKEATHNWIDVA